MRRRRIQSTWDEFRAFVIPEDAPPDQLREMRRAFFAGARCTLSALIDDVGVGRFLLVADSELVRDYEIELQEFIEAVLRGDA